MPATASYSTHWPFSPFEEPGPMMTSEKVPAESSTDVRAVNDEEGPNEMPAHSMSPAATAGSVTVRLVTADPCVEVC